MNDFIPFQKIDIAISYNMHAACNDVIPIHKPGDAHNESQRPPIDNATLL